MKFKISYLIYAGLILLVVIIVVNSCNTKNNELTKNTRTIAPSTSKSITEPVDILKEKSYFPSLSNEVIYYLGDGGTTFYSFLNNQKTKLIDLDIPAQTKVYYSPDGSKAIINDSYNEFGVNGKIVNILYDFKTKKSSNLNSNIRDLVFTKDGNKIIYYFNDNSTKNGQIYIANPDGSSWEKITDTNVSFPNLSLSKDGKKLLLYSNSEGYENQYVYLLNLNSKQISKLTSSGHDLYATFSPDNQQILYETLDPKNNYWPILTLMNSDGSNNKSLNLRAFANKIAWVDSNSFIFAMDPNLPADYYTSTTYQGNNNLYIYSIYSQQITQLNTTSQFNNISNLMYDSQSKTLYFTNGEILYSAKIN